MELPIISPADPITLNRAHNALTAPKNDVAITRVLAFMYSMLEHRLEDAVKALKTQLRKEGVDPSKSFVEAQAVAAGLYSGVDTASAHPLIKNVRALLGHVVDRLMLSDDRLAAAEECLALIQPVSQALNELVDASSAPVSAPCLHS